MALELQVVAQQDLDIVPPTLDMLLLILDTINNNNIMMDGVAVGTITMGDTVDTVQVHTMDLQPVRQMRAATLVMDMAEGQVELV